MLHSNDNQVYSRRELGKNQREDRQHRRFNRDLNLKKKKKAAINLLGGLNFNLDTFDSKFSPFFSSAHATRIYLLSREKTYLLVEAHERGSCKFYNTINSVLTAEPKLLSRIFALRWFLLWNLNLDFSGSHFLTINWQKFLLFSSLTEILSWFVFLIEQRYDE